MSATPEWLRPVGERFLGGDPGRPPWTVRLAAVDWQITATLAPSLVAAAVSGFGLVLVLRTGSASSWLAKRRYQIRRPGSEGQRPAEQAGGG